MRVLVTGAGGFIGKNLIAYLAANNIEVIAFSRSEKPIKGALYQYKWAFGKPFPKYIFLKVDCAIHLAHDFNGHAGANLTIDSSVKLVRLLKSFGIKKQLFFSSYSASCHSRSLYGNTKYKIEQVIKNIDNVIIVRPGLVIGEGGIYKKIIYITRLFPILPLPNGGHGRVPIIYVNQLNYVTLKLIMTKKKIKEFNLFLPNLTSLRELIIKATKKNFFIIPIPYAFFLFFLTISEALKIPLPIKLDNLLGFIANQNSDHKASEVTSL
jgi:nucleoside-diphosphate-sugar epimerase